MFVLVSQIFNPTYVKIWTWTETLIDNDTSTPDKVL